MRGILKWQRWYYVVTDDGLIRYIQFDNNEQEAAVANSGIVQVVGSEPRPQSDPVGAVSVIQRLPGHRLVPSSSLGPSMSLGGDIWGGIKEIGGKIGGAIIGAIGGGSSPPMVPGGVGLPPLPPAGPFGPQLPASPTPGVGGTVARILPGGSTGYSFQPVVEVEVRQRAYAPPGYVVVDLNGQKVAMLKVLARKYGLWKPRPKPPVSGWDMKAINRANRAQKRVKGLASKVGFTCVTKGTRRASTGTARKKC
jgi:hypothetical protein